MYACFNCSLFYPRDCAGFWNADAYVITLEGKGYTWIGFQSIKNHSHSHLGIESLINQICMFLSCGEEMRVLKENPRIHGEKNENSTQR